MQAAELKTLLASILPAAQSAALIQAARKDSVLRAKLTILAERIGKPGLDRAIKQHLQALLPADSDAENELAALLASPLPSAPRKPAKRSKPAQAARKPAKQAAKPAGRTLARAAKPKPAPTVGRVEWTGQPPISESTGNPLPWWQSSAPARSGEVYFNFGRAGYNRTVGATLEVWREVLSNADELLADLEDFAS